MKFSFSLRKLWLFQTLVACLIGFWFAWQKWSHLFDPEYWKFQAFNRQLSSVPLSVGEWEGEILDKSRFSLDIRDHFPPAFSSRVYQHADSNGEMMVYLVAGHNIKDMVQMHPLVGRTNGYQTMDELSLTLNGSADPVELRSDLYWSVPDWQSMKLAKPRVCLSTLGTNADWGLPRSFKLTAEDVNIYRVWVICTSDSSDVESEVTKAAVERAKQFTRQLLPEISAALFSEMD